MYSTDTIVWETSSSSSKIKVKVSTALKVCAGVGVCVWAIANVLRFAFRREKTRSYLVLDPPFGVKEKKSLVLIFLPGTAQNIQSCWGRMQQMAAQGYECHALNIVDRKGEFFTSYAEQMRQIREYVMSSSIKQRPFVIIGHSQGGSKAQMYALEKHEDSRSMPQAIVLLASSDLDVLNAVPRINFYMMRSRPVSTILASITGMFWLEATSFTFGGGPLRHLFGMYRGMFIGEKTTLLNLGRDDSVEFFADHAINDHDPFITDLITYSVKSTPKDALNQGLKVLHLVAAEDRVVPPSQSVLISKRWNVKPVTIPNQGHEMGDAGWEHDVMKEIGKFLCELEGGNVATYEESFEVCTKERWAEMCPS